MGTRSILILTILLLAGWGFAGVSVQDEMNKIQERSKIQQLQITPQGDSYLIEGRARTLADKDEAAKTAHKDLKANIINNIIVSKGDRTDEDLNLDVLERIASQTANRFLFNTISVDTHNGHVVLYGKLRDAYLSDVAENAAAEESSEIPEEGSLN